MTSKETAPTEFSDLLNQRCLDLGLFTSSEVAAHLIERRPILGSIDLARNVRNWQAGRNMPRPDFYRVLLDALEIGGDARIAWNRAYRASKSPSPVRDTEPAPVEAGLPLVVATPAPSHLPRKRWLSFRALRWQIAVPLMAGVAATAVFALGGISDDTTGPACDAASGAAWDPQRNPAVATLTLDEVRPSAIALCDDAVRAFPEEPRFWFQLGRAHERHAQLDGDYGAAFWAYRRADRAGHVAASLSLGLLYEGGRLNGGSGEAEASDRRNAALYYARAAAGGLPTGLYCHAIATLFGWDGTSPDPTEAKRLAAAAVSAGSRHALELVVDLESDSPFTRHTGCA